MYINEMRWYGEIARSHFARQLGRGGESRAVTHRYGEEERKQVVAVNIEQK